MHIFAASCGTRRCSPPSISRARCPFSSISALEIRPLQILRVRNKWATWLITWYLSFDVWEICLIICDHQSDHMPSKFLSFLLSPTVSARSDSCATRLDHDILPNPDVFYVTQCATLIPRVMTRITHRNYAWSACNIGNPTRTQLSFVIWASQPSTYQT